MATSDYQRIERAITYIESQLPAQPTLDAIAKHVGLSEYHFHRLFQRWAGITPKRFQQYLTAEYARQLLHESHPVLDVADEAGLSGTGRLHDLFVTLHGVTPGEVKQRGKDMRIEYGVHDTPFGQCFIAITPRGVCAMEFIGNETEELAITRLQQQWSDATLVAAQQATKGIVEKIFNSNVKANDKLQLIVHGTNFQVKVWEALLKIPPGHLVTYQDIAQHIGMPKAARAVGNAIGQNSLAFLIPCHRVIRKTGIIGEYRWGHTRKKAIIAWEAASNKP